MRAQGLFVCCSAAIVAATCVDAHAAHRNIFIVGGQSNAKPVFAESIRQRLDASGQFDQVSIVHSYHPGAWLSRWVGGSASNPVATETFQTDFFNDSNTGALESQIQAAELAGDTWSIDGFFWFQGEGDYKHPPAVESYESRFNWMLDQIEQRFATDPLHLVINGIGYNPDFPNTNGLSHDRVREMSLGQLGIAERRGDAVWVDTQPYERSDYWHITHDELIRLGTANAEAFLAIPSPPGAILLLATVGCAASRRRR